ncbi:MAG: hypothetical protein K2N58_04100 [Treponemataceae bacterium]|nr:hypothetical protein [Treponemataceae bacterium]
MKKHAMQFLAIILIFISNSNASDAKWKSVQDVDLSESIADENNNCVASVEKFDLKNNFSLIIRPVIKTENENKIICTQIYLQSNGNLLLILDGEDAISFFRSATKYLFRYKNIDFDNYFCLTKYDGAYYYYLFDKRNGNMILNEFLGSADLDHDVIFYLNENDEMILYDLEANKKYNIDKYIDYGKYGSMSYWKDFKIVDITEENYLVLFWGRRDKNGDEVSQLITVPK